MDDNRIIDRRATGATHSFRLTPRANDIMNNHPAIIPNSKHKGKSAWASKAIEWFFKSPVLGKERDQETGDFTGKYVLKTHGMPTPIDLMMEIEKLEQELQDISRTHHISDSEAKRTPPGGGIWARLLRIGRSRI
jgi:hypothetical protein